MDKSCVSPQQIAAVRVYLLEANTAQSQAKSLTSQETISRNKLSPKNSIILPRFVEVETFSASLRTNAIDKARSNRFLDY